MWNSDQKTSSTEESDKEDGNTEHGMEADYMDRLAAKTCVQTTDGSESEERDNSCGGDESNGEDQSGKRSLPRVCEIQDETEGHSIRGMDPVELCRKAAKRTHAQFCRGPEGVLAILEEEGSDRDTGTPKRSRRNSGDKGKHPSRRDPQKSQRRNKKNAAGPGTYHDKQMQFFPRQEKETYVLYVYGPSGVRKSTTIFCVLTAIQAAHPQCDFYMKMGGLCKWWNSYNNQFIAWIDDPVKKHKREHGCRSVSTV